MRVWELPVQELQLQRLLVLERSIGQAQRRPLLVQRAQVPVQGSRALHRVQADFQDSQPMNWLLARRTHFPFAARPI